MTSVNSNSISKSQSQSQLKKISGLTREQFEESLHQDVGKPVENFRMRWVGGINDRHRTRRKVHNGGHRADWSEVTVDLNLKSININVYLNFKQNSLSQSEYVRLKTLACDGINQYWSRNILVSGQRFRVVVNAFHREGRAIPADLYLEKDDDYSRSMNPSILGIDASFTYNKAFFDKIYGLDSQGNSKAVSINQADNDFKLVSAHEFGHSVLTYSEGVGASWGHKGSTHAILQSVKSSTPGYPKSGPIDLMKYYDPDKQGAGMARRVNDTIAMGIDVKRLIWGAKITWIG